MKKFLALFALAVLVPGCSCTRDGMTTRTICEGGVCTTTRTIYKDGVPTTTVTKRPKGARGEVRAEVKAETRKIREQEREARKQQFQ